MFTELSNKEMMFVNGGLDEEKIIAGGFTIASLDVSLS